LEASLLSNLTFWWINKIIYKGYKRSLTKEDLWDIDDDEKSDKLTKKLGDEWKKSTLK
jgi:hypothetical protein